MRIADLLSRPVGRLLSVQPETPLQHASGVLDTQACGGVVVRRDGGPVEGVLTDHDVVVALRRFGFAAAAHMVSEVMETRFVSCACEDPLCAVLDRIDRENAKLVLVVDRDVPLALLSARALTASRLRELEAEMAALRRYMAA